MTGSTHFGDMPGDDASTWLPLSRTSLATISMRPPLAPPYTNVLWCVPIHCPTVSASFLYIGATVSDAEQKMVMFCMCFCFFFQKVMKIRYNSINLFLFSTCTIFACCENRLRLGIIK